MNKKVRILAVCAVIFPLIANCQSNRWKRMRYELCAGIGATNFLGELGGADKPGAHYFTDLDMSMTRPAFMIGGRYLILKRLGAFTSISYGWLRGDDKKTGDKDRNNRNLQFRSPIWEWQNRLEFNVLAEKKGHRYNLRNVRGMLGNNLIIDIFGGIALFYFNPRGKDNRPGGTGKYYSLRSIGTEGQNFVSTRSPYSRVSLSFPVGVNFKYILNKKWSVGWEFGIRQTITDYIDDVSTTYVDVDQVAANAKGNIDPELARYFADPSISRANGNTSLTAPSQQRGCSNSKDMYIFSFFTLNYKVRTGRNGLPRL